MDCWFWNRFLVLYFLFRSRISFAAKILHNSSAVATKFKGTFVVAAGALLVGFCLFGFQLWTIFALIFPTDPHDVNSAGPIIFLVLFIVFFNFWAGLVLYNLVHVTVCGVVAHDYNTPLGVVFSEERSRGVTKASLRRALTTSFGTVCFGSLIIAFFKILKILFNSNGNRRDGIGSLPFLLMDCLFSCIKEFLEFMNKYAFVYVAIYGLPLCDAAKNTWELIKDCGLHAVVNENISCNFLNFFTFMVTFCSFLTARYIFLSDDEIRKNPASGLSMLVSLTVPFSFMIVATQVIDSGSVATYVSIADNPAQLAARNPALFESIRQIAPDFVQHAVSVG